MKKIDIAQILGVLANFGVLAGILLLVYELNQNRDMMRAQTRHDLSSEFVGLMTSTAVNEQLAVIRRRGDSGEELTPDEQYRYDLFTRGVFRYWEDVHYQYRLGMYDESEFVGQRDAWAAFMARSQGAVAHWCTIRNEFAPEYQREMNALLTTFTC